MNEDYPDNSESNISNTEVSGSFSLESIIDISATVKHGTSKLKLKRNTLYVLKLGRNDYAIIRVLKDGSMRCIIHDDKGITKEEL